MRRSSVLGAAVALLLGAGGVLAADAPRDVAAALDGRLVRLESGRLAAVTPPDHARYFVFYFGASWCGPCRAFVPELKQGYSRLRTAAAPVEVVFVSDDSTCRSMADYMHTARMPWPAVACRDRRRFSWLQRARGEALPGLLVYDADGALVVTSWSADGNSRPRTALAKVHRLASGQPRPPARSRITRP